jgi:hypothetical protein
VYLRIFEMVKCDSRIRTGILQTVQKNQNQILTPRLESYQELASGISESTSR